MLLLRPLPELVLMLLCASGDVGILPRDANDAGSDFVDDGLVALPKISIPNSWEWDLAGKIQERKTRRTTMPTHMVYSRDPPI
jgi:hypothetical protein